MTTQPAKIHDPMYNFDTHFPERLSRLHLHGDFNPSGSFRKKKNRAPRNSSRYKTQPVTFDEITEVDEEPSTGVDKEKGPEQLKGQLQAFSRSMDGLLPKGAAAAAASAAESIHQVQPHITLSRSGSRKFHRHPDCIPERADLEQQPPTPTPDASNQSRLQEAPKFPVAAEPVSPKDKTASSNQSRLAPESPGSGSSQPEKSPIPSPNIGPRRQKVTAKAKKRQKALEDGDVP